MGSKLSHQYYHINIIDPVDGDDIIITKFFIEGNMLTSNNGGWHFIISNGGGSSSQGYEFPVIGYGVYKVYTIQSPEYYFYIDYRDQNLSGGYDISVKFNTSSNTYSIFYGIAQNVNQFVDVPDKSIKRIWEIIGEDAPLNSDLQNFWQNCLVIIPSTDNHPHLVWGAHPTFNTTHYRIYRAVSNYPVNPSSLTYSLISTINNSTFDFIDYAVTILPDYQFAYYYVVGWNGTTQSAKTNYVSTQAEFQKLLMDMPTDFSISQNYPNPFNPSTTIKFSIPEKSFVTLKVYDVLGNEVATLVNEDRPSGTYEVEFNVGQTISLSSGVYYYQLKAGGQILTRKMILMK